MLRNSLPKIKIAELGIHVVPQLHAVIFETNKWRNVILFIYTTTIN